MLHRAARNAYSWWWASHIRTKQSKWLEENLQDMEGKVEYILKIIDEEGDSFAQRAEMYYKRRPELVSCIEETFRGYRALAERYDHISKEMQSANRAIAAIYPERVHLELDDDDDSGGGDCGGGGEGGRNLAFKPLTTNDSKDDPKKHLPVAPEMVIERIQSLRRKKSMKPSRAMSKKGLLKFGGSEFPTTAPSSGLTKSEALEEIDKLQKGILALQTEKEFVRSSYQAGLDRYWDIENQMSEMHAKVSSLQDEFGIGSVIEDDKAKTLMIARALKSCQETLTCLHGKQDQLSKEAKVEYRKIEEAQERLETFKGKHAHDHANHELRGENKVMAQKSGLTSTVDEKEDEEEERKNMESLRAKIKEQFSLGAHLTISDLGGFVDILVDKVINLEMAVSSLTAYVEQLRSEANELQARVGNVDGKEAHLSEDSDKTRQRIKELEEELHRVQSLNQRIVEHINNLHTNFMEASLNLRDLSMKLLEVAPEGGTEGKILSQEVIDGLCVDPSELFRHNAEKGVLGVPFPSTDTERKKEKDLPDKSKMEGQRTSMQNRMHKHDFGGQVNGTDRNISYNDQEEGFSERKRMPDPATESLIKRNEEMQEEVNVDGSVEHDAENNVHDKVCANNICEEPRNVQVTRDVNANAERDFQEIDIKNLAFSRMVSKDNETESEQKEHIGRSNTYPFQHEGNYHKMPNRHNSMTGHVNMVPRYPRILRDIVKKEKNNDHMIEQIDASKSVGEMVSPDRGSISKNQTIEDLLMNVIGRSTEDGKEQNGSFNNLMREDLGTNVVGRLTNEGKEQIQHLPSPHDAVMDSMNSHSAEPNYTNSMNPYSSEFRQRYFDDSNQNIASTYEGISTSDSLSRAKETMEAERNEAPLGILISTREGETQKDQPRGATEERRTQIFLTVNNHLHSNKELDHKKDEEPNWKELFLNSVGNKEKILLQEYESAIRNFNDVKMQLYRVESSKRASLFQSAEQIKALRNANSLKDMEIQSLQKKLMLNQTKSDVIRRSPEIRPDSDFQLAQNSYQNHSDKPHDDSRDMVAEESSTEKKYTKVLSVDRSPRLYTIEEKVRVQIDDLLEENINFYLRFSTAVHQIQKFQTSFEDLNAELKNLKDMNQERSTSSPESIHTEMRPIYNHLREIQTELTLWLEHTTMLKDDLQNRFLSLSDLQQKISRLSKGEGSGLNAYQAAKIQGEILNMKQENNKVAGELEASIAKAKELQVEIGKTVEGLEKELGLCPNSQQHKNRGRIPLRSFLFGVKLKKQKRQP